MVKGIKAFNPQYVTNNSGLVVIYVFANHTHRLLKINLLTQSLLIDLQNPFNSVSFSRRGLAEDQTIICKKEMVRVGQ